MVKRHSKTPEPETTSSTFLQKLTGLATTCGILSIPFYVYTFTYNLSYTFSTSVFLTVAVLILENNCRRSEEYNESMIRPSFMLNELSISFRETFKWIGFHLAKLTDLFYWIREYIFEDLANILRPTIGLCLSWLEFFKGYYNYYVKQSDCNTFIFIIAILFGGILLYIYYGTIIELSKFSQKLRNNIFDSN